MEQHHGIVRWAISSTGNIAAQFADAFINVEGGRLVAVGFKNTRQSLPVRRRTSNNPSTRQQRRPCRRPRC